MEESSRGSASGRVECPACHHLGLRFIGEEKIEDSLPPVLRHYSICFHCGNYWYYDEKMEKAKMYMGLYLNQPIHIENAKKLPCHPSVSLLKEVK